MDSKGQTPPSKTKKKKDVPTEQIIERLSEIDGVTSRVAENLVEKGIYSREALSELSRDELMDIKGIGPKRAEKILGQGVGYLLLVNSALFNTLVKYNIPVGLVQLQISRSKIVARKPPPWISDKFGCLLKHRPQFEWILQPV